MSFRSLLACPACNVTVLVHSSSPSGLYSPTAGKCTASLSTRWTLPAQHQTAGRHSLRRADEQSGAFRARCGCHAGRRAPLWGPWSHCREGVDNQGKQSRICTFYEMQKGKKEIGAIIMLSCFLSKKSSFPHWCIDCYKLGWGDKHFLSFWWGHARKRLRTTNVVVKLQLGEARIGVRRMADTVLQWPGDQRHSSKLMTVCLCNCWLYNKFPVST